MGRKNVAAEEVRDLRGALAAIGRVVEDGGITPKGRLQQICGILGMYDVRVTVAAAKPKTPFSAEAIQTFSAAWLQEKSALFGDVPAGVGE